MADFRWWALGCIDQTRNRMDSAHKEFPDRPQKQTTDKLWILCNVTFKVTKVKQDERATISELESSQWHNNSKYSLFTCKCLCHFLFSYSPLKRYIWTIRDLYGYLGRLCTTLCNTKSCDGSRLGLSVNFQSKDDQTEMNHRLILKSIKSYHYRVTLPGWLQPLRRTIKKAPSAHTHAHTCRHIKTHTITWNESAPPQPPPNKHL